ncbi:nitroreductase family protein [Salinisphaera sp. Q1T1-3]|uniref:nitroreductase family protein n=1 Tax=Salinisphaera sp. Q1T1-3 TaxID=2321229 RepID=UPI000E76536D|nr:nitroreductase family protein [Salinisphaera sp. Q1T1-3]RJS92937.1 nitroreductase [Salinisphaera sp. Q1T1-3]
MTKTADTDHKIHNTLATRWSPYLFAETPVDVNDLQALFEAARWAPSSYNEQPWRFIVGVAGQGDDHQRILDCLAEPNRVWAGRAPVLVLGVVVDQFVPSGTPNKAAEHDLGLAVGNLLVEATVRGLSVHQMIGVDADAAKTEFGVPDSAHVLTAMAIGHADKSGAGEAKYAERDNTTRTRKPLPEFVFGTRFGTSARF